MTKNTLLSLTVEELNMLLLCTARSRVEIIEELNSYLETAEPDMAEIIRHTIEKAHELTEEELKTIFMRGQGGNT